jgi:hypothetical protein
MWTLVIFTYCSSVAIGGFLSEVSCYRAGEKAMDDYLNTHPYHKNISFICVKNDEGEK